MNSFVLKIIGIITMFCDHLNDAIVGHYAVGNLVGRIAFPIFAYQVSQSYIHTKNIKKFMLRLFIFALIAQAPFMLLLSTFTKSFSLNIFFTMLLGIASIYAFDKIPNKFLGSIIVIITICIAQLIKVDYGAYGVTTIFVFYLFNNLLYNKGEELEKKKKIVYKLLMCISFIVITFTNYLIRLISNPQNSEIYIKLGIATIISLIPIYMYNGKEGPKLKYLFYIFYPMHLLILYLVHILFIK